MTRSSTDDDRTEQLVRLCAGRTGLPVDELDAVRARRRAERRRLQAMRADAVARTTDAEQDAFRRGVRAQREALARITATTTLTTLSEPDAIDGDHTDTAQTFDFDRHLEPFNSFARVHAESHSGGDGITVEFRFTWSNPQQTAAVVNIGTLLRFTGFVEAISDNRLFGGDSVDIFLSAFLRVVRGSGWGVDADGNDLAGTQVPIMGNIAQNVAQVHAQGGGLFGDVDLQLMPFSGRPVGLGTDFVVIPGGASAVFTPALLLQYGISDGGDRDDVNDVIVDFASTTPFNRGVGCPFMHVEILT